MQDLRFTLRQIAIAIAVISVVLAFLVLEPMSAELLATASIPAAVGFMIAALVRYGVEKISGCSMRSPWILLILILVGMGFASLAITILNRDPRALDSPVLRLTVVLSIPTLLGFVIYQVSQGSVRFRLTIEILTLVALLALSAQTWRPRNLIKAAEHADTMAAQISEWAERPNTPKKRDVLRRESEWFRRRAFSLRCQAYWYGLIYGPAGYDDYYPYDTEHLVHELGILEMMDAHEMRARLEYEEQNAQAER